MSLLYGIITNSANQTERKEPLFSNKQFRSDMIDQTRGLIGYATIKGNPPEKAIIPGQALVIATTPSWRTRPWTTTGHPEPNPPVRSTRKHFPN